LVVESIKITKEVNPKFFIFENVRAFLNTTCTDIDGTEKTIEDAIKLNLGGHYNILFKVVNFKDYGSHSSRTRTLVIGVRKDLQNISSFDIFPEQQKTKTLRKLFAGLENLNEMGKISEDFYLGVPLSGRAFRSNLLFVPLKRISTSIPNALKQVA